MRRLLWLAVIAGCGEPLEVESRPYRYTVRNAAGEAVLTSTGRGQKDGYGALGWTTGRVEWSVGVTPGYATFEPVLDPWRDDWEVVAAQQLQDELKLTLATRGEASCVQVSHRVVIPSVVRTEARRTRDPLPRAWSAAFQAAPPRSEER